MKETCYRKSVLMIVRGMAQFGVSIWHTIYNHPCATALLVSMVMNVWLFVGMANARVERDQYNQEATLNEMKLDSVEMLIPYNHEER